eukprot:TRINITY_DN75414_c0_g1_i1.p1 TRINITY_DN75414_c0_g1~~TRINITY_DN75414_c0_g1_i1.p1  ORF type:complete len:820 (+),score=100.44 TRINITY_DN75414_c0_g1_i1:44-2503(+)
MSMGMERADEDHQSEPSFEHALALLTQVHARERRRVTELREANSQLMAELQGVIVGEAVNAARSDLRSASLAAVGDDAVRSSPQPSASRSSAEQPLCDILQKVVSLEDAPQTYPFPAAQPPVIADEATPFGSVMAVEGCRASGSPFSRSKRSLRSEIVEATLDDASEVAGCVQMSSISHPVAAQRAAVMTRNQTAGDTWSSEGRSEATQVSKAFGDAGLLRVRPSWCQCDVVKGGVSMLMAAATRRSSQYIPIHGCSSDIITDSSAMILRPTSMCRICWDVAGMALICYDLVTIPLQAFDLGETWWSSFAALVGMGFWALDIIGNFFVGFHSEGQLVLSPSRVAHRYLISWFLPDTLLVGADIYTAAIKSDESVDLLGFGRAFRVVRTLKILRLLRLLKLRHVVDKLQELINSEHTFLLAGMCRVLCIILIASHLAACTWFFVGSSCTPEGAKSWVEEVGVLQEGFASQYLTSLHFVLCIFTPASVDVHPQNATERAMAVLMLIGFLVTVPSLVSSVTTNMTKLRNVSADEWKSCWVLRCYLKQRNASKDLSLRILRYVEFVHRQRRNHISESCVDALELISEPLRQELNYEVCSPQISVHPCLRFICSEHRLPAQQVFSNALAHHGLAVHDVLFSRGTAAGCAYFITKGTAVYERSGLHHIVKDHDWFSETALWSLWRYAGDLVAETESAFVSLDAVRFAEVMQRYPTVWAVVAKYAERYVSHVNDVPKDERSDLRLSDTFFEAAIADFFRQDRRVSRYSIQTSILQPCTDFGVPWGVSKQLSRGRGDVEGKLPHILGSHAAMGKFSQRSESSPHESI